MKRIRIIPILSFIDGRLVKTVKFKSPNYLGDPVNAIKIFNDKEVDEIAVVDIRASLENQDPNYELIMDMASECFMPMSYGGGIKTFEQAKRIFDLGVEKLILNSAAVESPSLINQIASVYGAQSVVVSIDYKTKLFGKKVGTILSGSKKVKEDVISLVKSLENEGMGELLLTNIDNEGTFQSYDLEFLKLVSDSTKVPVVANGGLSLRW